MILFMQSALYSLAATSSHYKADFSSAIDMVEDRKNSLFNALFPYINISRERPQTRQQTYDELFAELDDIIANEKAEAHTSSQEDAVEP